MFENKTVVHALVYDKKDLGIDENVRRSLKVFYKRNLFIDEVPNNPPIAIIEDSPDSCMISADRLNFDYLILTWEGNIFQIYHFHYSLLSQIEKLDERTQGKWLICGHIMDQYKNRLLYRPEEADKFKNSFWLFPITAVINLSLWRSLGKPKWGDEKAVMRITKGIPSEESVHDGYTPLVLYPSEEIVETKVKTGWNIIDQSLKNGIPVYNLTEEVRQNQNYLYPENNPELYNKFWRSLQDFPKIPNNYEKVFKSILESKSKNRILDDKWSCFLRNTEESVPESKSADLPSYSDIDCIMIPCSGFKDFIMAKSILKVKENSRIIHYDILSPCIDIRKRIVEEWDGTSDGLCELLKDIESYYRSKGKHKCFHMNAMKDFNEVFLEVIKFFRDENDLQTKWRSFQNLEHQWINVDLLDRLDDYKTKIRSMTKDRKVYLCLSDIAGWRHNILGYGTENLRNSLINAIETIIQDKSNSIIDYKDPATDFQHFHTYNDSLTTLTSYYEI